MDNTINSSSTPQKRDGGPVSKRLVLPESISQKGPSGFGFNEAAFIWQFMQQTGGHILEGLPDTQIPEYIKELYNTGQRELFILLSNHAQRNRTWWERHFFDAGFRKHPRTQQIIPYECLQNDGPLMLLCFERIPNDANLLYPLPVLKKERDLHMDMLRESGSRSDAHIGRYQLAADIVKDGDVILDAACGLGYGSALLATQYPQCTVIGVDNSSFAISYATANYCSALPNLEFHLADICQIDNILNNRRLDVLVSFETIEHIPEPDLFLAAVCHHMSPNGRFIASVPNVWIDENGGPGPYHFQIFDFALFESLIEKYFGIDAVYRQNAEHGLKGNFGRILRRIKDMHPSDDDLKNAEWWIASGHFSLSSQSVENTRSRPSFTGSILECPNPEFEGLADLYRMASSLAGSDCMVLDVVYGSKSRTASHHPYTAAGLNDLKSFQDNSFDLVLLFHTIGYVEQPDLFLKEVNRILKPGGVIIASAGNSKFSGRGVPPGQNFPVSYDLPDFVFLLQRSFATKSVYGRESDSSRLVPVNLPATSDLPNSDWVIVAFKAAAPKVFSKHNQRKITVLSPSPEHSIYSSWLPYLDSCVEVVSEYKNGWLPSPATDLIITHDTYEASSIELLQKIAALKIPILVLADGILEYRNTWQHPQLVAGAIFQPVLGDKIACLGKSQARFLESWGNSGKCEVIGLPGLDRYYGLKKRRRKPGDPFTILISTALTPYFTEIQHDLIFRSLADLRSFFNRENKIFDSEVIPVWRLTKNLSAELDIGEQDHKAAGAIYEHLCNVDAVITTPSTVMLESMLLGLPVAVIDYTNSPQYVQPAWSMTSSAHIPTVVEQLLHPSEARMLFQETILHDSLECSSPSLPRLLKLIDSMVITTQEARKRNAFPIFPDNIIENTGPFIKENRYCREMLYPDNRYCSEQFQPELHSRQESITE